MISNNIDSESVYLLKYINKILFSFGNSQKLILFRKLAERFLIKIKFTKGSQEAFFIKIGVPINIFNQNCRKIAVKELIFLGLTPNSFSNKIGYNEVF